MSLTSPTAADMAGWLATALDTSKPLLERQMAASCMNAAVLQVSEGLRLLEKLEVASQNAAGLRLVGGDE